MQGVENQGVKGRDRHGVHGVPAAQRETGLPEPAIACAWPKRFVSREEFERSIEAGASSAIEAGASNDAATEATGHGPGTPGGRRRWMRFNLAPFSR